MHLMKYGNKLVMWISVVNHPETVDVVTFLLGFNVARFVARQSCRWQLPYTQHTDKANSPLPSIAVTGHWEWDEILDGPHIGRLIRTQCLGNWYSNIRIPACWNVASSYPVGRRPKYHVIMTFTSVTLCLQVQHTHLLDRISSVIVFSQTQTMWKRTHGHHFAHETALS